LWFSSHKVAHHGVAKPHKRSIIYYLLELSNNLLGGAGAVGVGSNLEVHAIEWLGALHTGEVVVAITPPSAF
jgi:hypothetical protein